MGASVSDWQSGATKQSPLSLKEGGPLAVGDSRRVWVIGKTVQRRHTHANPANWKNSAYLGASVGGTLIS